MEKIPFLTLVQLMDKKQADNLKLLSIELIKQRTASMCLEHTYSVAFHNLELDKTFICEYEFNGPHDSEWWDDNIMEQLDYLSDEEDVLVYPAEIIYVPKYVRKS